MRAREPAGLASFVKCNISGEKLRVAVRACSYLVVVFLGNNKKYGSEPGSRLRYFGDQPLIEFGQSPT